MYPSNECHSVQTKLDEYVGRETIFNVLEPERLGRARWRVETRMRPTTKSWTRRRRTTRRVTAATNAAACGIHAATTPGLRRWQHRRNDAGTPRNRAQIQRQISWIPRRTRDASQQEKRHEEKGALRPHLEELRPHFLSRGVPTRSCEHRSIEMR